MANGRVKTNDLIYVEIFQKENKNSNKTAGVKDYNG